MVSHGCLVSIEAFHGLTPVERAYARLAELRRADATDWSNLARWAEDLRPRLTHAGADAEYVAVLARKAARLAEEPARTGTRGRRYRSLRGVDWGRLGLALRAVYGELNGSTGGRPAFLSFLPLPSVD